MTRINTCPLLWRGSRSANWAERDLGQTCEEGVSSHCNTRPGAGEALSKVTWGHCLHGVEITSTHQLGNWNEENKPMR